MTGGENMQQTLPLEGKSPGKMYNFMNNWTSEGTVGAHSRETSTDRGVRLRHFKQRDLKVEAWIMNRNSEALRRVVQRKKVYENGQK